MPAAEPFTIAVLPFLKTSAPVEIAGVTFRSTQDLDSLHPRQAKSVSELNDMLFLQDHLRIDNASYAVVPFINLDRPYYDTSYLERIQLLVAFLYISPHEIFGTPFLTTEHASMVLFTPTTVHKGLTQPTHNVVQEHATHVAFDSDGQAPGYAGLYNFRHHFWVARGSRVYGPLPHPTLNINQDLHTDIARAFQQGTYRILFDIVERPQSPMAKRVFTALRWYNSAHLEGTDDLAAIVHLAIAFEALLGLPQHGTTERLVDAISLLLGRVPRLDDWAAQFYDARSAIVHEGYVRDLAFKVSSQDRSDDAQTYQSLFAYGTQAFRLCLGTLLVGSDLADRFGLEERLVTNQERYTELCRLFAKASLEPEERLQRAAEVVRVIERYRFVTEPGLQLKTMIASVRRAARTLLDADVDLDAGLAARLRAVVECQRTQDHLPELTVIRKLSDRLSDAEIGMGELVQVVAQLVDTVWGETFMHYYWLKETTPSEASNASAPAQGPQANGSE